MSFEDSIANAEAFTSKQTVVLREGQWALLLAVLHAVSKTKPTPALRWLCQKLHDDIHKQTAGN